MIIGNGQLAKAFMNSSINHKEFCILASGVANSSCEDPKEFARERDLLIKVITENKEKKIIFFSSCVLSASEYPKNSYYQHKANMETLIISRANDYYIFRLPQIFGDLFFHKTLINFIWRCIEHNHAFKVFDNAYRYVIEIDDVRALVEAYINSHDGGVIIDFANPFRYRVLDIVKTFECLLDKKANYNIIKKDDQYLLNLTPMLTFVQSQTLHFDFGKEYLLKKLFEKLKKL